MGAGSSRADAPSRRRARLSLGGCFGAGSSSSSSGAAAVIAAEHGGGSFTAAGPSSSRAIEVQSRQSGRPLSFQASLAAKDLQISSESNHRLHSSSSTISHHLRFNHLNCHENKEDVLGTENAESSGLESSSRKAVMVRGSLSNEAVSSGVSGEGISFIGSELENVPSTVSTNEIGGSTSESGLGPSLMTSERIMSDLEGEISPQGASSTTAMTSERSDVSQSSFTSMSPNSSTASSATVEPMPDPIPTRADVPMFSGPHGESGGSILHDDMMSIFSSDGLGRSRDSSSSETRRSHRRILWDAFSRRGSRGYPESDADDLGFYSTWLDLGDDIFEELGESRYFHRRRHGSIRVSQYSRSRIREHRRTVFDSGHEQSTATCPLGIHPIGRCTCDSFLIAEESSARASISRIVMLTEALFEVLDEIHRQPASLSLSMVSAQAPESVVNSLPCKSYKKLGTPQCSDDMEQCHICLTEYEDGDQIRTLPCKHEFHLQCVDKWLKEIHRVCPLCRGDVCEVAA